MSQRKFLVAVALLATAVLGLPACGGDDPPAAIDAPTAIDAASVIDAPMTTDAAGGETDAMSASPTEINCGTATCPRASQVCCFTGPPNITTTCTAIAGCSNLPGRCDGPEDCGAGEVCCGGQMGSSCVAADQCTGFSARLCHSMSDCPSGQICRASQFVAWPICANS